jgi:hypothetical protein
MALFRPGPKATIWLLLVAVAAVGAALFLRYRAVELSTVGLACQAGEKSWLCFFRSIAIALFTHSVFGIAAIAVACLNLLRPSVVLVTVALAAAGFGVVLYNVALSALAVGLLIVSLSRRAVEPE